MERLKLVIIDDVETVVEGLAYYIPWGDYGIVVVGTAANGEAGIDLIERVRPEIVLTDIRMPKLNGLDMISKIVDRYSLSKFIILSGYNDFEYAQQAIRLGAFDFIAKPFTMNQIVDTVLKAKDAIQQETEKMVNQQQMERRLKESLPLLRQEYFSLLVHQKTSKGSALHRWEFLDVEMSPEQLVVMVVEVDSFAKLSSDQSVREIELLRFALQNILEETMKMYTTGIVFRETMSRFVCMMNQAEVVQTQHIAERCREHIEKYTKVTISVGIGQCVEQLQDLPSSYEQAVTALSYHFYTGGNGVYSFLDIDSVHSSFPMVSIDKDHELFYAIRSANADKSLELLDQLFLGFSSLRPLPKPDYLLSLYYELGYMLIRTLLEKVDYAYVKPLEAQLAEAKLGASRMDEVLEQLRLLCKQGCELLEKQRVSEAERLIGRAIQYINENLHTELSLIDCARYAHLSVSYFSNLFKKETGLTFVQYVTHERMERAKSMLIEDISIQEISDKLGFEERRYFSEVFKKHTGLTPSEYKGSFMRK
jgi:two-component system response regulator YesN